MRKINSKCEGMLVMFPGQKPSMVRVEQLSYAWSQDYKRREFVKFRHLVANTAKHSNNDSWRSRHRAASH